MSNLVEAKLLKAYNEDVMKFSEIRELMKKLVENAGSETLDSEASAKSLRTFLEESKLNRDAAIGEPRRVVIAYLNEIWLSGPGTFSKEFWWEMRYRILKLLHVSIILEAFNLKSFGVTKDHVNERKIPQCLIFVYDYVKVECTDEKLKEVNMKFEKCCNDQREFCNLYLNVF